MTWSTFSSQNIFFLSSPVLLSSTPNPFPPLSDYLYLHRNPSPPPTPPTHPYLWRFMLPLKEFPSYFLFEFSFPRKVLSRRKENKRKPQAEVNWYREISICSQRWGESGCCVCMWLWWEWLGVWGREGGWRWIFFLSFFTYGKGEERRVRLVIAFFRLCFFLFIFLFFLLFSHPFFFFLIFLIHLFFFLCWPVLPREKGICLISRNCMHRHRHAVIYKEWGSKRKETEGGQKELEERDWKGIKKEGKSRKMDGKSGYNGRGHFFSFFFLKIWKEGED